MNKKITIYSLAFAVVFFIAPQMLDAIKSFTNNDVAPKFEVAELSSELFLSDEEVVEAISSDLKNDDLPVSDTTVYLVEDPEGVVVFIPQTHMNPGTKVGNPINDSAEVAQKEIYEIINHLNKEEDIDLVMLEGEKFGLASDDKLLKVSEKIAIRENLILKAEALKKELKKESVPSEKIETLLFDIEKSIAFLDREIALHGAPYKIKAENEDVVIYGSENPDTYEESSVIVKNYIYQKDRLGTLQKGDNASPKSMDAKAILAQLKGSVAGKYENSSSNEGGAGVTRLEDLKKMLSELNLDNSFSMSSLALKRGDNSVDMVSMNSCLDEIETIGELEGNDKITKLVDAIKEDNDKLENIRKVKTGKTSSVSSRRVNPYSDVSEDDLREEIKNTENQIQEVVIDRRNQETAKNFKAALKQTNNEIGVLQFGAGHEEGLIEELNKQKLTVLVVKSDELSRRESAE